VIGLWHCPYPNCNEDNYLGDILYQGPYSPLPRRGGFFQNFTLIVPAGEIKGEASLHVAQFYTVGVSVHFCFHRQREAKHACDMVCRSVISQSSL
jgi:hypothetical protein